MNTNTTNRVYNNIEGILFSSRERIRTSAVSLFFGNQPKETVKDIENELVIQVAKELNKIIPNKRKANTQAKEVVNNFITDFMNQIQ